MVLLDGILHILWHIVLVPIHIVGAVIKYFIVAPIVMVITLVLLLFLCAALLAPGALRLVPVPNFINDLSYQFQQVISGPRQPSQVTCVLSGHSIVVRWTGPGAGSVEWYQVARKTVQDPTWRRIALVPASSGSNEAYAYRDTQLQPGVTYLYGVVAIRADGTESDIVASPIQIVAP